MTTGTLTLNFETPDSTLTGLGEFDVSETFKDLFFNNPALKDEIGKKISSIFKNIKGDVIAKDFTDKLKKSFEIDSDAFNITETLNEQVKGALSGLSIDPNILGGNNAAKSYKEDTVFNKENLVTISDFTDQAIKKLSTLFGVKDTTKKKKGENDEDIGIDKPQNGFLNGILGGLFAGVALPALITGLTGVSFIAGGLVWMAIDGIRGWFKAEDWGVSKISGALGAALGGMGKDASGALKNAGKGAAIGSGIGIMIGGPIGLIVGALIGAALGGILGWIGGETLAKNFDTIGVWFKSSVMPALQKTWKSIKDWYYESFKPAFDVFVENIMPILKSFGDWLQVNILPVLKQVGDYLMIIAKVYLKTLWKTIKWFGELFGDIVTWLLKNGDWIISGTLDTLKQIWNGFKVFGEFLGFFAYWLYEKYLWVKEKFTAFGQAIGDGAGMIVNWLIEKWIFIKEKFTAFGQAIGDGAGMIVNWLIEKWTTIKEGFMDFGKAIGEGTSIIMEWIQKTWTDTLEKIKTSFTKMFDWLGGIGDMIKDKIKGLVDKFTGKNDKEDTFNLESNLDAGAKAKTQRLANTPTIETKDIVIQPSTSDKFEPIGVGGTYSQSGGLLDKKFDQLIKVITDVQRVIATQIGSSGNIMKNQSAFLTAISNKLDVLPALIPQPAPSTTQIPSIDVRDPIYEYRGKLYDNRRRGL